MVEYQGIFKQINNAILDLQNSTFQSYQNELKRLARLLDSDELTNYNHKLTKNVDLDGFLGRSNKTVDPQLLVGTLEWPDDDTEIIALRLLLIRRLGGDPDFVRDFSFRFYHDSSGGVRCVHNLVSKMIVPFFRDYKDYIENNGSVNMTVVKANSSKVFIVHGHDDAARQTVCRFVERLGLEAIILHEQLNQGQTIIEKFERYSDVGFAIAILSPDDLGRSKQAKKLNTRARQNVILELGYFIGKLGRNRVCSLKTGDVEIPSDILGVIWQDMDNVGAWQLRVAREMQAAGYNIDLNRLNI